MQKIDTRLKSTKTIDMLFLSGQSKFLYPIKMIFLSNHELVDSPDVYVTLVSGVTVSKRSFKRAVDRNRIKRMMREAIRLSDKPVNLTAMYIYVSKEILPYQTIEKAINIIHKKLRP